VCAPDLLGLHTQGDSLDEATANAQEALELYVEGVREDGLRSTWASCAGSFRCLHEPAAAGRLRQSACHCPREARLVGRSPAGEPCPSQVPGAAVPLVVPLHRELKRGTLDGILKDAGLERNELRRLL